MAEYTTRPNELVTANVSARTSQMYVIYDHEVNDLNAVSGSLVWTVFGIAAGALISLWTALQVLPTDIETGIRAQMWGALYASIALSVVMVILGILDKRRGNAIATRIRKESVARAAQMESKG